MPSATEPIRLSQLAAELGRDVVGDGGFLVRGVAALEEAGEGDLSFVRSRQWLEVAYASLAGALILPEDIDPQGRPAILSPHPELDFARAVERILVRACPEPGIHEAACVDPSARVDAGASIDAGAVVGARVRLGRGTVVHPRVTLYPDVVVGEDCVIHAGVVVREGSQIGDRVVLQPGAVIGGDGFGFALDATGRFQKVPQVGKVVLEDDVEVGANSTVDRASLSETRIRRGAKIDNLVQIGHNCDIGEDAVVVAQSGLSGTTRVGRGAILMARVGVAGHLTIGDGAFVGARAGIHKDVLPGTRVWGSPQLEERAWHKAMAALARLPEALRRLRAVERALGMGAAGKRGRADTERDGDE